MERGRDNKAARGELFLHLPIGYVKSPSGDVLQEPDEQARDVVRLVFEKFTELGSAWRVFRYLVQNNIQFGYRQLRDYDQLISRIKTLHGEGKNVQTIAEQLNREGFVPPRRRGPL